MASSTDEPPVFVLDPDASCKYPGQSFGQFNYGYNLVFTVTAPTTGTLCITDLTVPNGTATVLLVQINGAGASTCISIPEGQSQIRIVVGSSNSANGTGTFTGSFNGVVGTFAVTFSAFNPCTRP